ncbi:hypothetical protein DFQ28_007973 [Apophysomyces sp. BC1034]|nr:hypothetical protein DFQ29_006759 [Apophysomyces sp. BC1021]KAG0186354.1 hypothetical protein DFQ28_007973 [Apophysomyces sp. BC1034]
MEALLTELTHSSIKDLERNDFQLPCQKALPPFDDNDNDEYCEEDDTSDEEDELDRLSMKERLASLDEKDFDSIRYTGHSAGLKLFDQGMFKSKPYIQWPGRDDVVLQMMSQNELMVVRTERSATGKYDTKLDVMKRLRDSTRSRLCYVQAALLMTLYLDLDDSDVESIQWHTLGSAIRIAQDLGLHRSCAHWKLPASEIETRHRVFHACYILDRWMSVRAGKPLTILDRDFDTAMPSLYEVSDTDGTTAKNEPIYRSFNLMIKLSEILGRVIKAMYAPKAKHANGNAGLDDPAILVVFDRRLQNWKASLDENVDGFELSAAEKVNLLIPYYTIVLLLHRPFIESPANWLAKSQQISFEAASSISEMIRQKRALSRAESSYPLCLPTCFVYAMFQSALVHLAAALSDQSSENLEKIHQSVALIQLHKHIAPAHRALETLKMLAAINGLELTSSPSPSPPSVHKTDQSSARRSDNEEEDMPKSAWFHRMINADIVGGIGPDIHRDVQSMMTHPSLTPYLQTSQTQQQSAEAVYPSPMYQPVYTSSSTPLDHFATAAPSQLPPTNHTETCYEQPQFHPPSLRTLLHNSTIVPSPTPSHSAGYIPATSMEQTFVSHHHHHHQPTPQLSHTPVTFSAYSASALPATLPSSNITWSDWSLYLDQQHTTASPTATIPTVVTATSTRQPILSTHLQHVPSRLH